MSMKKAVKNWWEKLKCSCCGSKFKNYNDVYTDRAFAIFCKKCDDSYNKSMMRRVNEMRKQLRRDSPAGFMAKAVTLATLVRERCFLPRLAHNFNCARGR